MFTLEQVVPWGRSFDEYRRMFVITDDELGLKIVGCGDGPASFNSEATRRGAQVVSCDSIYRIFPLLTLGATFSPLVDGVVATFDGQGFSVSIENVPYEFQRGGIR